MVMTERLRIPRVHFSRLKTPAGWLALLSLRYLPVAVLNSAVSLLGVACRLAYWVPRNPLRLACNDMSMLAAAAGRHDCTPRAVYGRLVGQLVFVGRSYIRLFEEGPEAVRDLIGVSPEVEADWLELMRRRGGLVVAVPHTAASVLAAVWFSRRFSALVLSTKYRSSKRRALYTSFFSRIQARPVHPVLEGDRCLGALRTGGIVVEVLDKVHLGNDGIAASIFGQTVSFPPWASNWAAELGIPLLPCYLSVEDGSIKPVFGPLLESCDPVSLTQECIRFFESRILQDPASWTFMLDRRWRRVVRAAVKEQVGRLG